MKQSRVGVAACLALAGIGNAALADVGFAQDKQLGAAFTTELTAVRTAGNSETNTFGLDALLTYAWERADAKFQAGAVRAQSTLTTRTAVGTSQTDFTLTEDANSEKTAEAFYARGRYDRHLSSFFYAFGGADWLRNTFAGIDSRILFALGAGNIWTDGDRLKFKTDYSATYTFQQDVVENPFVKSNFAGARISYDLWARLTSSAEFLSVLIGDLNLDNTDDIRLDMTNALPVAISTRLAFKPSVQLLWRNQPSLTEVALTPPAGQTADTPTVTVPLQKLDSIFKVALVVKF
jgi:putative salt-induced outer membrane protein YdiY